MLQGTGHVGVSNYLVNTLIPKVVEIRSSNIFNYEPTDLKGFPACTVTLQEMLAKVLDNARNERIFRFTIRIFIDRNKQNFGASKTETILRTMADDLITQLDADPTLGGTCIDTVPYHAKYGYLSGATSDIRVIEITLDARDANTWR